ncbi:MAG: ABC transporter permease [Planctomycetaceae bacterium]|nr:ABC transporter permease [Planctomycetaceae bacterium]
MSGALVIIRRELLGLLRTRQALAILVGVAFAFSLVVILKWPASGMVERSGYQAREVFQWLAWTMMACSLLVVPVFPATSVVREVRGRTLELLLNSPLSRTSIFLGKAGAMLGFVVLLLFTTLPAMTCCYLMGGLSLTADVLRLYGFLFVVCIQLIVIGMLVGTWCRSAEEALRWSYGVTFTFTVLAIFPNVFLQGGDHLLADLADWLRRVSPIPSVLEITSHDALGSGGRMTSASMLSSYLPISVLFVVIGSIVCIRRLSHALLDRSRSQGIITDDLSFGGRAARRVVYLVDPQKRSKGISLLLNPVMVKEFRCRQFGRLHWLIRLVMICAVISLALTVFTTMSTVDWGVSNVAAVIIVMQVMLLALMTPGLSGGIIAGELESGGWDLLRVTPLSATRIMMGKLSSVLLTLVLLLCATLPGYGIIMQIEPSMRTQIVQVIISLCLVALQCLLISAVASTFFRRAATATTVAYGVLGLLFAGTMLIWVNRNAPFGHTLVEWALRFNPMAAALHAMDASDFGSYQLIPSGWWIASGICVLLIVVLYLRVRKLSQPD